MSSLTPTNGAHSSLAESEPREPAPGPDERPARMAANPASAGVALALVLRSCHLQLMGALRMALHGSDVTNTQYFLLCCFLARPDRRTSPSELSEATGETRSNTTRICEKFVRQGWLQRTRSVEDRRRVDMSMTHAGAAFTEALVAKVMQHNGSAEVLLSASEYAEALRVLTILAAALSRAPAA